MINHISIGVNDPEKAANILAELWGGVLNFFVMMPGQPMWFVILSLLSYIPLALLGHRMAR